MLGCTWTDKNPGSIPSSSYSQKSNPRQPAKFPSVEDLEKLWRQISHAAKQEQRCVEEEQQTSGDE